MQPIGGRKHPQVVASSWLITYGVRVHRKRLIGFVCVALSLGFAGVATAKAKKKVKGPTPDRVRMYLTADEYDKAQQVLDQLRARTGTKLREHVVRLSLMLAERCVKVFEEACAAKELTWLRGRLSTLSRPRKITVHRLQVELAFARARLAKASHRPRERTKALASATTALMSLLRIESGWEPPKGAWSADQLALLSRLRAQVRRAQDRTPPRIISVTPPAVLKWGEAAAFSAQVTDDASGVRRVTLVVGTRRLAMTRISPGKWQSIVPGSWVRGSSLEFRLVAEDGRGNKGRWGTAAAPKVLPIPPVTLKKSAPSLIGRWWFWLAVGAGIAATAVTTYFLTLEPAAEPVFSTLKVGVTWPQ